MGGLAPVRETVYLIASHEVVTPVSHSVVRELIYFRNISSCVPQAVVKKVEAKRA